MQLNVCKIYVLLACAEVMLTPHLHPHTHATLRSTAGVRRLCRPALVISQHRESIISMAAAHVATFYRHNFVLLNFVFLECRSKRQAHVNSACTSELLQLQGQDLPRRGVRLRHKNAHSPQ